MSAICPAHTQIANRKLRKLTAIKVFSCATTLRPQPSDDRNPSTTWTQSLSLSLSAARTRPNWNIWLTVRVIIIFFKLVCANFSLCESFPLAIQLASSLPLHLFLFPSRCRAIFSCCRCFCVQPQIILSKTLSPIFLHPQRVFFLCAFSPAAAPPLPSSSSLIFFGSLFGFYHVVGNYALCEIQRTNNFWATTSSSECISCNAGKGKGRGVHG